MVCGPFNHLKGEGGMGGGGGRVKEGSREGKREKREGWIKGKGKFEYT